MGRRGAAHLVIGEAPFDRAQRPPDQSVELGVLHFVHVVEVELEPIEGGAIGDGQVRTGTTARDFDEAGAFERGQVRIQAGHLALEPLGQLGDGARLEPLQAREDLDADGRIDRLPLPAGPHLQNSIPVPFHEGQTRAKSLGRTGAPCRE